MVAESVHRPSLIRLADWPAPLMLAWRAAQEGSTDVFESNVARRWRPDTRCQVEKSLSKLLTVLKEDGANVEATSLIDLVIKLNLKRLVQHMRTAGLKPNTQRSYMSGIYLGAMALAPEGDWTWIKHGLSTLKKLAARTAIAGGSEVGTDELLLLGNQLFRQACADGAASNNAQAAKARDALIIASLALRPLRRANLVALRLGETVLIEQGGVRISIPADQMKMQKRAYEAEWPATLLPALRHYLDRIRPVLLQCYRPNIKNRPAGDALWVSHLGTAMTGAVIHRRVRVLTQQAFGRPITLHRFRTIAATTLANKRPEEVHLASEVLGHNDQRSREWYIRADQLIAARRSHAVEDRIFRGIAAAERRPKRTSTV